MEEVGEVIETVEMGSVTRTTRATRVRLGEALAQWETVTANMMAAATPATRGYWTIYDTGDQVEKSFSTFEEYQEYLKRTKSKGLVSLEDDLFTA